MALLEQLKLAGVDVEGALRRFSGNESLYLRFILKFPQDDNFDKLGKAMEAGDFEEVLGYAHTLKGLAANLGMMELSKLCDAVVRGVRSGATDGVADQVACVAPCYHKVMEAIQSGKEA